MCETQPSKSVTELFSRRRWFVYHAVITTVLVIGAYGTWFIVFPLLPDEPQIAISTETTYITEPLDAAGFPDYVTAINRRNDIGVSPENNAAVPLLQAYGPALIPEYLREEFFRWLGMTPLPEQGDYFLDQVTFANQLAEGGVKVSDGYKPFSRMHEGLPWKGHEHPLLLKWLDRNAVPMDLVIEASQRKKLHTPLIIRDEDGEEAFWSTDSISAAIHEASPILVARAFKHAGEGDSESARHAALTLHRLALLSADSPVNLTALAIDKVLIEGGRITAQEALAYQAELYDLPWRDDSVTFDERCLPLHIVIAFAHGQWNFEEVVWPQNAVYSWKKHGTKARLVLVDWDAVLRFSNETLDRVAEVPLIWKRNSNRWFQRPDTRSESPPSCRIFTQPGGDCG